MRCIVSKFKIVIPVSLFSLALVLLVSPAWASCTGQSPTWFSTPDYASVSTCVSYAQNGDTINIGSGSATWNNGITITKSINLIGAGQGNTIVTDNYSDGNLILISSWTPIAPRVSGMTINGGSSKNDAAIAMKGASSGLGYRIDHITFNNPAAAGVATWDWVWGVIDHCTFNTPGVGWCVLFNNDSWGGSSYGYGDKSWNDPDDFGTYKFSFVEDCTFNNSGSETALTDSYGGARYVLRHNTFNNGHLVAHGTDSTPGRRGTRAIEVYNNNFINNLSHIAEGLEFRSGTTVFYNNTASGFGGVDNGIVLKDFRYDGNYWTGWQRCDGTSYYDQNSDSTGYACLDQSGRGQGNLMTSGSDPQPHAWPNQALSPVYIWGNTGFNYSQGGTYSYWAPVIKQDRDFYLSVNTPKPGYTAYTYPHPLVSSCSFGQARDGATYYYGSTGLNNAYNNAYDNDVIQSQIYTFTGDIVTTKNITFAGGYDSCYSSPSEYTTLLGSITINSGVATIKDFILQK